jgi:hypothetical protein
MRGCRKAAHSQVVKVKGGANPPRGFGSDDAHASSGSLNLGRRREHAAWRQAHPGHRSGSAIRRRKNLTAKSSTTRGPISRKARKGLPVSLIGDDAELQKTIADGYGRSFWFLPPEIVDHHSRKRCSHGSAIHPTIGPRSNHL